VEVSKRRVVFGGVGVWWSGVIRGFWWVVLGVRTGGPTPHEPRESPEERSLFKGPRVRIGAGGGGKGEKKNFPEFRLFMRGQKARI